jgi:hypothetical protein
MNVDTDRGQRSLFGLEVYLNPTPVVREARQAFANRSWLRLGQHCNTAATEARSRTVRHVVTRQFGFGKALVELLVGGAHLLEQQHIGIECLEFREPSAAQERPNTVHVGRGDLHLALPRLRIRVVVGGNVASMRDGGPLIQP